VNEVISALSFAILTWREALIEESLQKCVPSGKRIRLVIQQPVPGGFIHQEEGKA